MKVFEWRVIVGILLLVFGGLFLCKALMFFPAGIGFGRYLLRLGGLAFILVFAAQPPKLVGGNTRCRFARAGRIDCIG